MALETGRDFASIAVPLGEAEGETIKGCLRWEGRMMDPGVGRGPERFDEIIKPGSHTGICRVFHIAGISDTRASSPVRRCGFAVLDKEGNRFFEYGCLDRESFRQAMFRFKAADFVYLRN